MNELFSVHQYFVDGSYEKVSEFVPVEQALEVTRGLINSIGARLGTTQRVIITDSLDCIGLEWIYGKGITFPIPESENSHE